MLFTRMRFLRALWNSGRSGETNCTGIDTDRGALPEFQFTVDITVKNGVAVRATSAVAWLSDNLMAD